MKLIIDIPDHLYNIIRNHECTIQSMLTKAVANGIPLDDILYKIRAEIDVAKFVDKDTKMCKNANASGLEVAMRIIDKYRAEGDPQERNDKE